MGRKAKFGDDGAVKQIKGPGRKAKKQKPPKMLPGLPKLEGNILNSYNYFKLIQLILLLQFLRR